MFCFSRIATGLLSIGMFGGLVGCSTFHIPFGKSIPKASAADPVVQILCLWQQAEGRDPEGMPCRGFAGQILFLSNRAATPVQIEGEVRIYLFDDQGTVEEQSRPLRQFDFDNGSWGVHLAETSLGPTYHVFVPYVRRGTTDAACALRIRLTPKQGQGAVIFSDLANMPLNAISKPLTGDDAKPMTLEETEHVAAEVAAAKLRRTTTISTTASPQSAGAAVLAKQNDNSGQVQLASHEVGSDFAKNSGESDRIRQLESMVQQLLDQKSAAVAAPAPSRMTRRDMERILMDSDPALAAESNDRIRLTRRPAPGKRSADVSDGDIAPRRLHPLDDDEPSPMELKPRQGSIQERSSIAPYARTEEAADEATSDPR
jgi:hypothetical protein